MAFLIHPTTEAVAESDSVSLFRGVMTISADALDGAETVTIEYSGNNGITWATAQNIDGDIVLTASKGQAVMRGPGRYRVAKAATVSPCSVCVVKE